MAKSKSKPSATQSSPEKKEQNALVKEFYAVRAEVRRVTWPTREEARALSIAVTVATIVIAFFLFLVDFLFEGIIAGIVITNIAWIVTGIIAVALVAVAFIVNSREV